MYPEFKKYWEAYENGSNTYLNNMFIMRKDLFFAYSTWLFDILEECVNRMDFSDYSVEAIGTSGRATSECLCYVPQSAEPVSL